MLDAYEHVDRETLFVTKTLQAIDAEMKRREREAGDAGLRPSGVRDMFTLPSALELDPQLILLTGV
jgi:hypothetical protein